MGMEVALVVAMVVQVVVLEACMVHVRHMARKMGMVEASQVAPAWEEPRPDPPDSASPYSLMVSLHVIVPLPTMQAGGEQKQQ